MTISSNRRPGTDWKRAGGLLAASALVVLLWDTGAIYPLKLLVVFCHELSHALAAWASGGRVAAIQINAAQGGRCLTAGGSRFLILSAGYLGSLLAGSLLLMAATRTRYAAATGFVLGLLLLGVTLWFVRPLLSFGFLFGGLSGLALAACGLKAPAWVNRIVLSVIGITSCLYVPLDIKSDILDRPQLDSDAHQLAQLTGIPTTVWGLVWLGITVVIIGRLVRLVVVRDGPAHDHIAGPIPQD